MTRAAIALAVAALCLASCGEDEEPRRTGPPPAFGFNDNSVLAQEATPEQSAALTRRVGGTVTRLTLDWRSVEATPGRLDFRLYDRIYKALRRRGIRPLWIPMFAPRWAWDRGTTCTGDCRFPPSAEAEGAWRRLVAAIARRYPRSAGIEVWNEPNSVLFWRPRPDAARYTRLLTAARRAVRTVRPRMRLVTGGLANLEGDAQGNVSLEQFAEQLHEAGADRQADAIGLHVSPSRDDELLEPALERVRKIGDKPVWVTEVGATTSGPPGPGRYSEEEQADALVDSWRRLAVKHDVGMILVHTLIDRRVPASSPEQGFGVVRGDLTAKPAYCALAREIARRNVCR